MIRRESLRTNLFFAGCVVVFLAFDLWSKSYVREHYDKPQYHVRGHDVIPGYLSIWYKENAGGVFGIGQGKAPLFVAFTVVALGALTWLTLTTDRSLVHLNIGIALVTSGALGNLYDRVFNGGCVRDFIDCYVGRGALSRLLVRWFGTCHWYTYNIADACICVGVGLLMLDILLNRPRPDNPGGKGEAQEQEATAESK